MTLEIRRELIEARNLAYRYRRELAEERRRLPLLISGLIDVIPPVGEPWSLADREHWLETMRLNLNLLYAETTAALAE